MTEEKLIIENTLSDAERREYERYSTNFYLCVYDPLTDDLLGHVIDISIGGIKLLHKELIPVGQSMPIRMEAALENGLRETIELTATAMWTGTDENADSYNTGFKFLALSLPAQQSLQNIIAELSG